MILHCYTQFEHPMNNFLLGFISGSLSLLFCLLFAIKYFLFNSPTDSNTLSFNRFHPKSSSSDHFFIKKRNYDLVNQYESCEWLNVVIFKYLERLRTNSPSESLKEFMDRLIERSIVEIDYIVLENAHLKE